MDIMNGVLGLLIAQGVLGAIDTIYHHELTVALPRQPGARKELAIHSTRALLYGVVFAVIANVELHGWWVASISALVCIEIGLTLWDFVVEDNSRKLPATERILHTVLAINGGALFGLYAWQLTQWSSLPTAIASVSYGWQGIVLTLFAVGVAASGVRDGLAAMKLVKHVAPPNPFVGQMHRKFLVTGGTGFIGVALVNQLLDAGHEVTVWVRDPYRAAYLFDGRVRCIRHIAQLDSREQFDAVINLAGAPVVGPRWSTQRKSQLLASRLDTTHALSSWFANAQSHPAVWIQASAIGYYGVRNASERLDENSPQGEGFMAELCTRWEAAAENIDSSGTRRVTLRFGLVFGPGGALPSLLLPYRFGFGGRLGNGRQVMSWIHRDDLIKLIADAIQDDTFQGIYNAVSPEAVTQAQFAKQVGQVLVRPVWLHLPATLIRLLAGEMAQLFVDGQRVVPRRLLDSGFRFNYPTLTSALRDLA
jgi:uncharacterized protein (TIGR01777 family)